MSKPATKRSVVFVLYDGVQLLDVAGAADVFALAGDFCDGPGYEISFVATNTRLRSSAGLMLAAAPIQKAPRAIHTLVVPGGLRASVECAPEDPVLMQWLAQASRRAERVASICTGAFILGALGLLDGRRAATHWHAVERLAKAFPRVTVDPEALFVQDRNVWTSAGVASGIDLALALVTRDFGPEVALNVARVLVVHLVRPGGQSQFSTPLALQAHPVGALARLVPWIEGRLDSKINVEAMASAMGMSERSFHRHCVDVFGMSPGKLVKELKFDRARTLLAGSGAPVSTVALLAGFPDQPTFSKAFAKRFGTSPSTYRSAFAQA